jgi:hypothetical protein
MLTLIRPIYCASPGSAPRRQHRSSGAGSDQVADAYLPDAGHGRAQIPMNS